MDITKQTFVVELTEHWDLVKPLSMCEAMAMAHEVIQHLPTTFTVDKVRAITKD